MNRGRVEPERTTVILADPPWPHANGSRTNSGKSPKYRLMNLREIAAIGPTVKGVAGNNAVLFLWATTPHLPGALDVVKAWGFVYRSLHVWRKKKIACGFWARSNAELVVIAERGRPTGPSPSLILPTIFDGEAEEKIHSAKPGVMHGLIDIQWPRSRKVELFARRLRRGWECYGSSVGFIIGPDGIREMDDQTTHDWR